VASPVKDPPKKAGEELKPDRLESWETTCPDGSRVKVTRNIDTGDQTVTPLDT